MEPLSTVYGGVIFFSFLCYPYLVCWQYQYEHNELLRRINNIERSSRSD